MNFTSTFHLVIFTKTRQIKFFSIDFLFSTEGPIPSAISEQNWAHPVYPVLRWNLKLSLPAAQRLMKALKFCPGFKAFGNSHNDNHKSTMPWPDLMALIP